MPGDPERADVELNEELPLDPEQVAEALERAHENAESIDLPNSLWWQMRQDGE